MAFHAFRPQDDAEGQVHALEHWPLLDVQFEIRCGIDSFFLGFADRIDVHAACGKRFFKPDTLRIGSAAILSDGMRAGKRGRAEQAASEARAFFVGPIHEANRDRRVPIEFFRNAVQHGVGSDHAKGSIEPSAVRHGIEMAAKDQRLLRLTRQGGPAISGCVEMVFDGESAQPGLKPLPRLEPCWAPGQPLRTVLIRGRDRGVP